MARTFALAAAAAATTAAVAATAGGPCCAYGGSGAATAVGVGAFLFPTAKTPVNTVVAVGISGNASALPFATVLVGASTGPDDAQAGWSIAANATGQVLTMYLRDDGSGSPVCATEFIPAGAPGGVPGFDCCGGEVPGRAPLFPNPGNAFTVGGLAAGVFEQPPSGAALSLLTGADSCDVLALQVPGSPLNTGAMTVAFERGQPTAPPASWAQPPSWCPAAAARRG